MKLPIFDDIDKENLVNIVDRQIREHMFGARADFLEGKVSREVMEWRQAHADYLDDLQNRLIELLNLCPNE